MTHIVLLVLVVITSFCGSWYYRRFALQRGIIAKITFRSLHQRTVSRGGGIVFAGVFSIAVIISWMVDGLPFWLMLSFGFGGVAAAVIGFVDDVTEIRAIKKLFAQFCLAVWIFASFYKPLYSPYFDSFKGGLPILLTLVVPFISVWFINLYNFIDGIDGMAISGSVFICMAAVIILSITDGDTYFIFIFALLGASCIGFLFLNLPPASIFMGDSGSIFLGYCIGSLMLATIFLGQISIWTWIIILSYFIGDTTTTGVYRVLFVKKWYGVHRSHAYQNLARIYNSHAKITYGITFYHILWALPLAILSALIPRMGPVAAFFALGPAVLCALRFGPRLSSD